MTIPNVTLDASSNFPSLSDELTPRTTSPTAKTDAVLANNAQLVSAISQRYGDDNQLVMANEEMAELIQAISKLQRATLTGTSSVPTDITDEISQEMADVRIMLCQLSLVLGNDADVAQHVQEKLERQRNRMLDEDD